MAGQRVTWGAVLVLVVAAGAVMGDGRVRAQSWNPNQQAVDRCEQELLFRMGREAGGREPQAGIEFRSLDVRPQGRTGVAVNGRGHYRRDQFDRGRPYTFSCTYDTRTNATRVTYNWTGNFGGGYDDNGYTQPPAYRPPPSGGWGGSGGSGNSGGNSGWGGSGGSGNSYPSTGRVFYSGGIVNRASGRGLDVQDEGRRDGANVQQWDFGGKPNQTWDVIDLGNGEFSIVNQGSGKALDVANQNSGDGANVQQFRWHNGDNQRWRLQRAGGGFYQIVSVSSGRCLDVNSARLGENGANVQQWSCSGAPNQQWRLGR